VQAGRREPKASRGTEIAAISNDDGEESTMKSDNDPVVALTDPNRTPRPNARRMLLRGSFAAPTVLTLSSGSALANTSSLRCFNNMPEGISGVPENFYRVQRYTHTPTGGGDVTTLVKAAEITSVGATKFNTSEFTNDKDWIRVSDGAKFTETTGDFAIGTGFVALRFENRGSTTAPVLYVTGLANSDIITSGTGKILSHSCWSSFT
jgi:hypothetical protein